MNPQKILRSNQLPSLPIVAIKLLELAGDAETEVLQIVDVIKQDPAITAKILKSINSSFFGFSSKVTSLERAVPLMGTTVVTSLALSFSIIDDSMKQGPQKEAFERYWLQSVVQASATEELSAMDEKGLDCEYFLTGILLDLGRLAMLKTISAEYAPVLVEADEKQLSYVELEQSTFGFDHVEIGMQLMEKWKLPDPIQEAARHHHADLVEIETLSESANFALIKASAVAAAAGEYYCTSNKGPALDRLRQLSKAFYGFDEIRLHEFIDRIKERITEAEELFEIDPDELCDSSDLMAEANEHLAQLALRQHAESTAVKAKQEEIERKKQELESQNEQLQEKAFRDPLTKIYNRQFFDESLTNEISHCKRSADTIGLLFTDIDKFKQLNDTYGHDFGDEVLKRVAKAYDEVIRDSDVLARYGGEEFVIMIKQPTEKGLAKVAERVRAKVESEIIYYNETERVPVTVSVGATMTIPGRNENSEDVAKALIKSADQAMYDSKHNGRNQVHMRTLLSEQEQYIQSQINRFRFSRWLVAQQIFDIPTLTPVLARCNTPHYRIGELGVEHSLLQDSHVEIVRQDQAENGERFGETAIRLGYLNADQVAFLLAFQKEDPALLLKTLVKENRLTAQNAADLYKMFLDQLHEKKPLAVN